MNRENISLKRKLNNIKEDLPFMMCWANENWTRVWNGGESDVLLKQEYSDEDDFNHIQELITYFNDERYIKVNGKPMFIIYRPNLFPDIRRTIALWRAEVKKAGFPDLYIGCTKAVDYENLLNENAYLNFPIIVEDKNKFINYMMQNKIDINPQFYRSVNQLSFLSKYSGGTKQIENSISNLITLPTYSGIDKKYILKIIETINRYG